MKTIGIYETLGRQEAIDYALKAIFHLQKLGAEIYLCTELAQNLNMSDYPQIKQCSVEEFDRFVDMVISFGGDGTMLSLSRNLIMSDIPIIGFNVGKLGFLAEFSIEHIESTIHDIVHGNYRVVNRAVIETNFRQEKHYALNDFVIHKSEASMIIVSAFSGEKHIGDYRSDGLIISTPTGSTAYSLSCGGPILSPAAQVLCLTPIAPHSLTFRPLVIPDNIELNFKLHPSSGNAKLIVDGQIEKDLDFDDVVSIVKSEFEIKLVKPTNTSYYELLRHKLYWSFDPSTISKGR